MKGKLHEIGYDDFMDKFCKLDGIKNPKTLKKKNLRDFKALNDFDFKSPETEFYPKIVNQTFVVQRLCYWRSFYPQIPILQSALEGSGLIINDTGNWPFSSLNEGRKFDLVIYRNADTKHHEIAMDKLKDSKAENGWLPYAALSCSLHAIVPIEIKMADHNHAFAKQSGDDFLPIGRASQDSRGQLVEYATIIQQFQHRCFLFLIYIYRRTARLLRWDPVGALVTESFGYTSEPHKLLNFLSCIGNMTPVQLGYYPTVELASPEVIDEVRKYKPTAERYKDLVSETFGEDSEWPIYKLTIYDEAQQAKKHEFLVSKFATESYNATGRGTRGYIAFELGKQELVFLKDSWRSEGRRPEHEIYVQLKSKGARFITTLSCAGHIRSDYTDLLSVAQQTVTQLYSGDNPRIHYRLVVKEISIPLRDVLKFQTVLQICSQCFDRWVFLSIVFETLLIKHLRHSST